MSDSGPILTDEVEVDVCCDVLLEALEKGGITVAEVRPGVYVEVIPDPGGESGIAMNFCPFCGQPRPNASQLRDGDEAGA